MNRLVLIDIQIENQAAIVCVTQIWKQKQHMTQSMWHKFESKNSIWN